MTDLASAAPAIHHVYHAHPVLQPIVTSGVHYMSYFLIGAVMAACAMSAGLGYYVANRGIQGVANDLNNIKMDIANLKSKVGA